MNIRHSPQSLFKVSLLRIATNLWTTEESIRKIEKLVLEERNAFLTFSAEPVFDVQDRKDKVKELKLSDDILRKLLKRIDLVAKRLQFWLTDDQQRLAEDPRVAEFYLRRILWTRHGAVDVKKMELDLVENRHLDLKERYLLACKYCLREPAIELWNELKRKGYYRERLGPYPNFLVEYWTRCIDGTLREMGVELEREYRESYSSVYDYGFWNGVRDPNGNDSPVKYFWRRLSRVEKRNNLARLASNDETVEFNSFEVFRFCASIVNEHQREIMFEKHATTILEITVAGTLENHLYETVAKGIFPFMNYESFKAVLNDLIYEASAHPSKRIKRRLLFFWTSAPKRLRRRFARRDAGEKLHYGFSFANVVDLYKAEGGGYLDIANEIEYSRAQEI